MKVFILVFMTGQGDAIEIAAFDQWNDCQEVAYYLVQDLKEPANAFCETGEE